MAPPAQSPPPPARLRRLPRPPLVPLALAAGLFVLLAAFVATDPARGVTTSASPWTDESWNLIGPRNLVLLGRWSTDQWNLYLLELPFAALQATAFWLFGVGIVQARLVCIGLVALAVLGLGWGLRRPFGAAAATLAALGLATSALVLYYGRLVYLEDLVLAALVLATLTLLGAERRPFTWGLVGGVFLALATGTKASALFGALGIVGGVGLAGLLAGPDGRAYRRWTLGAVAALAVAAAGWLLVVYLPHRAAIADDMLLLIRIHFPGSLRTLVRAVARYPFTDALALRIWPLALAGGLGGLGALASLVGLRRRAGRWGLAQVLILAAVGWLVLGLGVIAVASHRPNRYDLPMLPALAILLAAGLAAAGPRLRARFRDRRSRVGLAVGLATFLAAPGLVSYAGWISGSPTTLPGIQAQARTLVPAGAVAVGKPAPIFLLRAPVVTIVQTVGAQAGADLYTTRGARWFVAVRGATVEPVARDHPAAWAARREVYCAPWGGATICIYQVP